MKSVTTEIFIGCICAFDTKNKLINTNIVGIKRIHGNQVWYYFGWIVYSTLKTEEFK